MERVYVVCLAPPGGRNAGGRVDYQAPMEFGAFRSPKIDLAQGKVR